ncbi:hypothetical protein XENOCAPTIV_000637 [Xenoophorus captivus]|uniref:Uncharacterized protein n=1 Tax=Xenoophorus captivus TaxID=1517983 RepID=A0ABV0S179_9TELE
MWLVFGGRGSPCAGVFVVYIARAPGNYRADATPTRGVWSQIRSLRSAAIYHASIRSAPDSCLFGAYTLGHTRNYCTYRHVNAPVDRKCAPDFGGGHFQSDRVVLPRYRARWQCAPHRSALSELHQAGATESPESGESGRCAGVGFHFGRRGEVLRSSNGMFPRLAGYQPSGLPASQSSEPTGLDIKTGQRPSLLANQPKELICHFETCISESGPICELGRGLRWSSALFFLTSLTRVTSMQ